ncbi:efflux RND transporter periplasmic adaptor subunit [Fulvivirgaceae bacterium BMA12]|uniref:Efflux RND transporter periplasmic adaptor subunit n=1 Tax=Agaribacillus aureus TaxID=3051825 RepID=A0ABT8L032_9BACT|nr:efflux RND transporter periplasmic adaptor subunit [Fulvivirgaceae bacterium BMA12]
MRLKLAFPLLFIVLLGAQCSSKKDTAKQVVKPVKYEKAARSGGSTGRTFSGAAKAGVQRILSFRVSGTLQRIYVRVGQKVKKGALIAALESSDYQLSYEESDASVKNADALEKQAKSNYERVRVLYENENTSLSEYESAKANFESAKANEKAAKQKRKQARSQLSYTRLYAPSEGIINNVYVEENENVSTGSQIVTLSSGDNLEVLVGIPESFITQISDNQKVEVQFSALSGKVYDGKVSEISYAIDQQTSTYPVTLKLEGNTQGIRPGMAADVNFTFTRENSLATLMVSPKAVGEDQQGNFVFVLEKENENIYIARKRAIQLGKLTGEGFEVQSGLDGEELIATAGLQTLLDGMKVRIQ